MVDKKIFVSIGIIVLLVIFNGVFIYNNISLNDELQDLKGECSTLKEDYDKLGSEKREIQGQLLLQEQEYEKVKSEVDTTINQIISFEADLKDSMKWFKSNTNLNDVSGNNDLKSRIKNICINNKDKCYVNLCCISFINSETLRFSYESDEKTSGKLDYLQSLSTFLENKEGDCEDFALLFSAELDYAVDYCKDEGYTTDSIQFTSCEYKEKRGCDITSTWYLPDHEKYTFPTGYIHSYPICYAVDNNEGHCEVAITDIEITSSNNVYESLNNAVIVEPLDWAIVSDSLEYSNYYSISKSYYYGSPGEIYLVIIEDDIIKLDSGWKGYADYLDIIKEQKEDLINLKE